MRQPVLLSLMALSLLVPRWLDAATVSGNVTRPGGAAAQDARITLATSDVWYFREARSDASGTFAIGGVPDGSYRLGVALRGYGYQEVAITVGGGDVSRSFTLIADTNRGRWTSVGDTSPELLEGTGSGSLSVNGEMFICHDTIDPVAYDGTTGVRWFPPGSRTPQGCHVSSVLTNGDIYYAGGSMGGLPQTQVTRVSEVYHRTANTWTRLADMQIGRWYPGIVRLSDERILLIGGEGPEEGYGRTDTCEIYDPRANTYTMTGSFDLPTEMPPALLLDDGRVMKTWRFPEFYDVDTGAWRPAPRLQQERLGAAGGDHADHEVLYLPDGRVIAIGIRPLPTNTSPRMIEFFTPGPDAWSYGANPRHVRGRPETALLPDGSVFVFGGEYTGPPGAAPTLRNAGQVPSCTNVADLYDPTTDSWRAMADANRYVHYHNITLVLPDGRVIATGGAGPGADFGDDDAIEVFEPPYLFRGIRPRIDALSSTSLVNGGSVTLQVSRTAAVSRVVLLGARSATHWIDGGVQRYLSLPFTQSGGTITATIPASTSRALPGWYMLYVLVDDIPSEARMVRVTASTAAPIAGLPVLSLTTSATGVVEGGTAPVLSISRSGSTSAPLAVALDVAGSARPGADTAGIPLIVPFAAGQSVVTLAIAIVDDSEVEGGETLTVAISDRAHYARGTAVSVAIAIADNDSPSNAAPTVSAGVDLSVTLPAQASLAGSASDDGLPAGSILALSWTVVSGPGAVVFTNAAAASTTASFAAAGSYVLRLTASDGALASSDDVAVTVQGASNQPPGIATPATVTPDPVTGTTAQLSVRGVDDAGEPALTYTWAATGSPPAAVNFSANGSNAARDTTIRFTRAGTYEIAVTIRDAGGLTAVSTLPIVVAQTATSLVVTPTSATVAAGASQDFTATVRDQFGFSLIVQPTVDWQVSGGGTITADGRFIAGVAGGLFTVTASSGALNDSASVLVSESATLIGHWRLDEASGTTTADSSGNGRTGTLVSGPGWIDGVIGSALAFDGADDHVAIADLPAPTSISIAAWIRPENGAGTDRIIVNKHNGEYDLRLDESGRLGATIGGVSLSDSAFIFGAEPGRWYHVAVTFDSASDAMRLYRDGQPVASRSNAASIGDYATELRIGRHSQFDFGTFLGVIDEVSLYGRALTADQVQALFDDGSGTTNVAPVVDAGPDRAVAASASVALDGSVSDDGLPIGSTVVTTWSVLSGPGAVTFADPASPTTSVAFATAGTYVLRLNAADGMLSASDEVTITVSGDGPLPAPWAQIALGAPTPDGDATFAAGRFTVTGAGADIWGQSDAGHVVYQQVSGDTTIVARVVQVQATDPWAKAGVMIRDGLAANARHAFMAVTPGNGTAFQRRRSVGGSSSHTGGSRWRAPAWVKLVRTGNVFAGYESQDGVDWHLVGTTTISLPANVLVCLPVTSHADGTPCTAVFDNVTILPTGNG